jgi:hypothetical protein
VALDGGLELLEALLMDVEPYLADLGEVDRVAGDRLGAVVNEKDKGQGQQQQSEEAKKEPDHDGRAGGLQGWGARARLLFRVPQFNDAARAEPSATVACKARGAEGKRICAGHLSTRHRFR